MKIRDTKLNRNIKSVCENLKTLELPQDESVTEALPAVGQFFKYGLTRNKGRCGRFRMGTQTHYVHGSCIRLRTQGNINDKNCVGLKLSLKQSV
jgi:hypothetical protein